MPSSTEGNTRVRGIYAALATLKARGLMLEKLLVEGEFKVL